MAPSHEMDRRNCALGPQWWPESSGHMSVMNEEKKKSDGGIFEIVSIIVQALVLALLVQMFLFQPFNIPSGSMEHTLRVGDYLFVSKWSYGYSRYSFSAKLLGIDNGIVPFSGRILGSDPKRGDIAVFRKPHDESIDYIKRVIGLPGDKIQVKQGLLYINGAAVQDKFVRDFDEIDYRGDRTIGWKCLNLHQLISNSPGYGPIVLDFGGQGLNAHA